MHFPGSLNWYDESGTTTANYTDNSSVFVTCAYDPNDKLMELDRGPDHHYILYQDSLQYTIRFQNTGNFTALNVRLEDTLSSYLDLNTLRPIASSHDYELTLNLEERFIEVNFPNINLPDSTSNFIESNGFFKYEISPSADAPEGSLVLNTASIFFDLNAPVITNTLSNKLVPSILCEQELEIQIAPEQETYCLGDSVIISVNESNPNLQWYAGSEPIPGATNSSVTLVLDQFLTSINIVGIIDNCSDSSSVITLETSPLDQPELENNLGTLTPTFGAVIQWYLNGEIIPGATSQEFNPSDAGVYSVLIQDEYACLVESLTYLYIPTHLAELDGSQITITPNPTKESWLIQSSDTSIVQVELINNLGVFIEKLEVGIMQSFILLAEQLTGGIYYCIISLENDKKIRRLIKI